MLKVEKTLRVYIILFFDGVKPVNIIPN